MVHDFDPFLWQISGNIGIRWYGLSYMVGFLLSYFLISWMCRKQKVGLTPEMVGDLVTYGAIGILVGGRLGYCIFYSPDLFLNFRSSFPFWGVLAVNEGGMASHGGMIGLVAACTIFAYKMGLSRLYLFDLVALCGPVGIFFGRLANFVNGELVGRVADASYPLAVKFPQDIFQWSSDSAKLQSLTTVVEKIGITKDQWLEWVDKIRIDSNSRQIINSTLEKLVEAIQNGNIAAKEAIAPLLEPRHPSQLYGAFGEGLFLFLVLFLLWRKPRKPGVIGSMFVIVYAIVRIVDEHFRMPDAHIGYQWLGLTRGQWLSAGMLLIGLFLLFLWGRRDSLTIPGWGRAPSVKIHRRS